MRSTFTLGFVFLALAGFSYYGAGHAPRGRLTPISWALMGLLVVTGLLIIARLRVGYYAGIATGFITALAGVLAWTHVGGSALALPIQPAIAVVVGLYLCMRVATTPIGPRPSLAEKLREDEPQPTDAD